MNSIRNEEQLINLAKFENFFALENFKICLMVWLRTLGLMIGLQLLFGLTGLGAMLGSISMVILFAANIVIVQYFIKLEAMKRYNLPVLGTAWWSFLWRLYIFVFPIAMALTMLTPEVSQYQMDQEMTEEVAVAMSNIQWIISAMTILPAGYTVSQAIKKSYDKMILMGAFNKSQDINISAEKIDEEKKAADDNDEKVH